MGQIWGGYSLAEAIAKQDIVQVRDIIKNDKTAIEHCWLESGSAYQPANVMRETALSLAVKTGNIEIVRELMNSGALLIGTVNYRVWGEFPQGGYLSTIGKGRTPLIKPGTFVFARAVSAEMAAVLMDEALKKLESGEIKPDDNLGGGNIKYWAIRLKHQKAISTLGIAGETIEQKSLPDMVELAGENKEDVDSVLANGKRNVLYSSERRNWSKEAEELGLYDYYEKFYEDNPETQKFFIPSDRPKNKK